MPCVLITILMEFRSQPCSSLRGRVAFIRDMTVRAILDFDSLTALIESFFGTGESLRIAQSRPKSLDAIPLHHARPCVLASEL